VATVFLFFFASTWAFGENMHKFARDEGILKSNQKLFVLFGMDFRLHGDTCV